MIEQEQRIGFNSFDKGAVLVPSFSSCGAHIPLVATNRYFDGIVKARIPAISPPQPPRPQKMTGKPKQPDRENDNGCGPVLLRPALYHHHDRCNQDRGAPKVREEVIKKALSGPGVSVVGNVGSDNIVLGNLVVESDFW